jgi:hypothetical protein
VKNIFINSINDITFKNGAEQLINQYRKYDDPINMALHICAELLWEYKHVDLNPNKREIEYWESTKKALEKIRKEKTQK